MVKIKSGSVERVNWDRKWELRCNFEVEVESGFYYLWFSSPFSVKRTSKEEVVFIESYGRLTFSGDCGAILDDEEYIEAFSTL